MKAIFLKILKFILRLLGRLTLQKYRPVIISINGSVGKSSTKEAVYTVLRQERKVRRSHASLNNEIGLPLAILGEYDNKDTAGGLLFWFKVICRALWQLIHRVEYPEVLILEYGADRPGDIDYLLSVARPDIAVVTALGEIPVHVEFYSGPGELVEEESKVVAALPAKGCAILNYDDESVFSMKDKARGAAVITYGFGEGADYRILGLENRSEDFRPIGLVFKIQRGDNFVPVHIDGVFGKGVAYAAAAAAAVASLFNIDLTKASSALTFYKPLAGRAKLIRGIKSSYIIDDSYNAAPLSTQAALLILRDLRAKRKIAVLGDMAELGKYAAEAHEEIGRLASQIVDLAVVVGEKARLIAEGLKQKGFPEKNILIFNTSEEAKLEVQKIIQPGDLILIKGSQVMRMEKITLEIMERPELASVLLPRQYGKWLKS